MKLLSMFLTSCKNKLKEYLFPEEEDVWIVRDYKFVKVKIKNLFKELK